MKSLLKKALISIAPAVIYFFAGPLFAFAAGTITINPNIPAVTPGPANNPGSIISNFYQFALMIAGVLALGAIVYGGVKYATSAGNPSAQSEGKEWILSALYGILLLAGAYIILYTINPNLVNLNPPVLSPVANSTTATPGTGGGSGTNGACGGVTPGTCPAGLSCQVGSGGTYQCTGTVNQPGGCGGATFGTCPNGAQCVLGAGSYFCNAN